MPGPMCCCCPSRVCVAATGQCTGAGLSGASVVLKDPSGGTIGTGTTDPTGWVCFDLGTSPPTGTYTATVTWTNGVVATGSVVVGSTCATYGIGASFLDRSCATVTGCHGAISGATVQFGTAGSATTNSSGIACISWASTAPPTSYTVTATLPTGPSQSQTGAPACSISFSFIDQICVTVTGCTTYESGAAVTILDGATTLGSGTTDGSGSWCFYPATDVSGHILTLQVTKSRYANYSASVAAGCGYGVLLTPATGYFCCPNCPEPLKLVLQVTDANGTHATKNGAFSAGGGSPGYCSWSVCYKTPPVADAFSITFSGCGPGSKATYIGYQIVLASGSGGGWGLAAQWGEQSCTGTDHYYATIGVGCLSNGQVSAGSVDSASGPLTGDCTVPTNVIGTIPTPGSFLPPPVTGSITITE